MNDRDKQQIRRIKKVLAGHIQLQRKELAKLERVMDKFETYPEKTLACYKCTMPDCCEWCDYGLNHTPNKIIITPIGGKHDSV